MLRASPCAPRINLRVTLIVHLPSLRRSRLHPGLPEFRCSGCGLCALRCGLACTCPVHPQQRDVSTTIAACAASSALTIAAVFTLPPSLASTSMHSLCPLYAAMNIGVAPSYMQPPTPSANPQSTCYTMHPPKLLSVRHTHCATHTHGLGFVHITAQPCQRLDTPLVAFVRCKEDRRLPVLLSSTTSTSILNPPPTCCTRHCVNPQVPVHTYGVHLVHISTSSQECLHALHLAVLSGNVQR